VPYTFVQSYVKFIQLWAERLRKYFSIHGRSDWLFSSPDYPDQLWGPPGFLSPGL